ncbi:unnamed protein product [Fraxinus pennsylvanica]|uniref:Uncharacterized protein n=1 Tax=Fraxinus pennsylvanica TaxID=56036 RepID=A0AAD2A6G4_9LAMI|nr:unnamed protein product [Fraxinus pennsylvanica]
MFLLFSLKVVRLSLLISFQVKVEDIETALDGEVTKIEESSFDAKSCTITVESISTVDEKLVLKSLYKKIAENQKVEEAMKTTAAKLSTVQGELERSKSQAQEAKQRLASKEARINELTEELGISTARYFDLELEFKNAMEKCAEHEGRANTTHQHSVELEDLMQISHVKAVEAGKKVSELQLLVETEKYRIKELEEQCGTAEAESLKNTLKVSELEGQLEDVRVKTSSLESAEEQLQEQGKVLEIATVRSIKLESLHRTITWDSEQKLQEALANLTRRASEAKSLKEILTSLEDQVKSYQEKLAEANERYAAVKEELDQIVVKLASSENANKELKQKILDAEEKISSCSGASEALRCPWAEVIRHGTSDKAKCRLD